MAAFLNKPSDFKGKMTGKEEPLVLLPPSAFAKPKSSAVSPGQGSGWSKQDVSPGQGSAWSKQDSTDEILALRLENQRLREKVHGFSMSDSVASAPTHRHNLSSDERRYADELIARQSEELSKLRSQVQRFEHEQQIMSKAFEQRMAETEREKEETVSALSDSLNRREEYYEQQIADLTREHEGEVLDLKSRLDHVSTDLDQSKGQLTSHLSEVMEELRVARQQAKESEESLLLQLREKESALQSQSEQIQHLRTYITESDQKHRPQQVWVQQCETLANKLKIAEAEKETLQSSAQLMEVRLSSLREILNAQEQELSKGKEEIDKNKLKELLLTRWRQKVYALLVQQKSAQLVTAKDLQNWKEKTNMLEGRLSSAHNSINILQHTVADKDADLKLAANSNKKLQEEVHQAEQVALALDSQINKDGEAVQRLAQMTSGCDERFRQQAALLQQAMGQFKALGQRITFASSRMEVLKSQLSRKEALKQLLDEKEKDTGAQNDSDNEETWRVEKDQVSKELVQLRSERDMLAAQLHRDSQTWADKIASMRSQYDCEVSSLKRTVEDLELANQDKARLLEQLHEELDLTKVELAESTERVDHLSTELARHQHTMDQALEEQKKGMDSEYTEQFADLEHKLNEAKREHTKAVVSARQQERQWGRERERMEETWSATESHYKAQLDHLHKQLQAVEKERNIFMATLRQEGLLGKLRSERGEPIGLKLQEEVRMHEEVGGQEEISMEHPSQESQSVTEVTETYSLRTAQDSSEPMSAVLEDLKSLVPALLDDSVDSSDDSQE